MMKTFTSSTAVTLMVLSTNTSTQDIETMQQVVLLLIPDVIISASLSVNIASVSTIQMDLSPVPSVGLCVGVCESVSPESVLWQNG